MDGGTIDRHPGGRARPGSAPGWYADPVREASLRRWNGEHWTADVMAVIDTLQEGSKQDTGDSGHRLFDGASPAERVALIGGLLMGGILILPLVGFVVLWLMMWLFD